MYINVKFLSNLIPFNAITAIAVSGQNFRSVHIAIADLSNTESHILCNGVFFMDSKIFKNTDIN